MEEDIDVLLYDFTSVKSFDACMLQYPPENQQVYQLPSPEDDPTVDDMNPLGVTQVT